MYLWTGVYFVRTKGKIMWLKGATFYFEYYYASRVFYLSCIWIFLKNKTYFFNNYTVLPASYFLYPLSFFFFKLRAIGLIIRIILHCFISCATVYCTKCNKYLVVKWTWMNVRSPIEIRRLKLFKFLSTY